MNVHGIKSYMVFVPHDGENPKKRGKDMTKKGDKIKCKI